MFWVESDMLNGISPLGHLLRLPLLAIPKSCVFPILRGPARGMKWIVGAGLHSCWMGIYEREKVEMMCATVRTGMTIFDVGAHAGYFSLVLSRSVGPTGRVVAFEPNPLNVARLRRHLHMNGITNVEVVEAAVSDNDRGVLFDDTRNSYLGKISTAGRWVPTVRLDDFGIPDAIKLDVEGFEAEALRGASKILASGRMTLFSDPAPEAVAILRTAGYTATHIHLDEFCFRPPNY